MRDFDYDIGVIGGGAAGLTVTSGAAQLGAKTLLIEKEKELGGDCLHFGCVPSKTLIKTARVFHLMKSAKRFGLPAVDPPPVDFRKVKQRIQSVISTIQKHDSEERFCKLGARVLIGEPRFIDNHSVSLDNTTYSARKWVIATGSSPEVPPVPGLRDVGFVTNKQLFSLERLPESMIILGAGPIATEMAQAFCRLGTDVHVIQRSGQILSREDKDMADGVMDVLTSEGVTFHLNSSVVSVKRDGEKKAVTIRGKDGKETDLRAETLLVALGRKPNTEDLGLEGIGILSDQSGIEVDSRMRTSLPHIYAAGDVTGKHQFTHAAGYEGGIVVSNAIFHLPRKADYTWLPWCTYTDPELASMGMNEKRAREAGIKCSVWAEAFHDNDRSLAEDETVGRLKMILDEKERLVGVQIFGPHAGELLNEWVAVVNGNIKLSTLAAAVHPYPTMGEINKKVAGSFISTKLFSETVKKGLKFFFNLKGRACGEDLLPEERR
jgi:pyruvate/2-oxoglutarate dehydrogenase complex dihydrolipoamide dehydrogenase (E3) component